jgi:hypothetical protein
MFAATRPGMVREPRTATAGVEMTTAPRLTKPTNAKAWALVSYRPSGRIYIRRVVWGRLLARAEKRDGETIKPVTIYIREPAP